MDLQVEENKQTRIKIQYNRQQQINKKKLEEKKAAEKLAKLGLRKWYEQSHPNEAENDYPCQICLMPLFEDCNQDLHKVSTSNNVYHRDCLIQYVKAEIEQGKLPVKNPDMNN